MLIFNAYEHCSVARTEFLQEQLELQNEVVQDAKDEGDWGVVQEGQMQASLISAELDRRQSK